LRHPDGRFLPFATSRVSVQTVEKPHQFPESRRNDYRNENWRLLFTPKSRETCVVILGKITLRFWGDVRTNTTAAKLFFNPA
jgi:hypothetical protein